ESGKQIAMGRDLEELRRKLGIQIKSTFSELSHAQFTRAWVERWDFGDLPDSVSVNRHGMQLVAYPALVDTGGGVALKLMDSLASAQAAHAAGLRRLLMLELKDEIKYLASNIPGMHEMSLWYATLGPAQELRDDILGETLNRAFLFDCNVRTAM